ncbi:MAG: DUF2062 domain-containing protein, partial [Planctomycetota bacterium]
MNDAKISKIAVVIPTYNNAATIEAVVQDVLQYTSHLIVVNDGATDETAKILSRFSHIHLVNHPQNQGKGSALLSGFQKAYELGYTHVITMDADGQHFGHYIPKFVEEIQKNPQQILIGVRNLKGCGRPLKSRILRLNSNFWSFLATGRRTRDSQSGFRAYPLQPLLEIDLDTQKYDFEIEVLVKLIWYGLDISFIPVEVGYGPGSISHFRPFKDFLLVGRLFIKLIFQALFLPLPIRRVLILKKNKKEKGFLATCLTTFRYELSSPLRFSFSVALGFFMAILPIWGFQMAAAFAMAHLLRLSPAVSLVASNISFPGAIPFILYASLVLGQWSLHGHIDGLPPIKGINQIQLYKATKEYLLGSMVLAILMAILGFLLAFFLSSLYVHKLKKLNHK